MTAKEKFKVGDAVFTRHPGHCLKGQDHRLGTVVGFCKDGQYVRVSWSGWKPTSSVASNIDVVDNIEYLM